MHKWLSNVVMLAVMPVFLCGGKRKNGISDDKQWRYNSALSFSEHIDNEEIMAFGRMLCGMLSRSCRRRQPEGGCVVASGKHPP
ncbi:hypothetical protein [Cardiobacterium valvarum]|uniref:hypothetical protein n=1 Tax=Cardiobacterium valvarum TaxID=194702 RepID=UPI0011C04621|nr:hypothetical protein [Cardiobacterium valvarum]